MQLNIFSRVEGPIYAIVYYHYKLVKHWCFCLVVGPDLPTQSISTRRPGLFPLTLHVLVSFLKLAFVSVNTTSDIKVPKRTKKAPKPASTKQQQSHLRPKHYLNCIWLQRLHHSPTASFECAFQISRLHLFICKIAYACVHVSGPQSVQTDDGDDETVGCVVVESLSAWPRRPPASSPPPSAPIPLLLTMLHIINQLWVGLPCKYPNESSFIKWLNGPDKSPNEEINNSVIVTLLILIRPSCSALIPAKRRSFFTVFSSACQHCCRFFFFLFSVLEASWWIVRCCRCFLERWKGFCDLWDALTLL